MKKYPLFVYGSLRPGLPLWWGWLSHIATNVREHATTKGWLYMTESSGYPWLCEGDGVVSGTLVNVWQGKDLGVLVDMELRAGYELRAIKVEHMGVQSRALAFVYPYMREDFIPVPGQDWRTWVRLEEFAEQLKEDK